MTVPLETLVRCEPVVRLVADQPDRTRRIRELPNVLSVLGCDAACDVVLSSDRVEDVHAAIARLNNGTYLCDLGARSGTSLNQRRIRWSRLARGDRIGVGPFDIGVDLEDPADHASQGLPVFSLRNDQEVGVVSSIDPVLIVGSDPCCDVVLHNRSVLPRHCIVIWTEEGPIVRDLLRRALTRLNGKRVNMGRLIHGDAIGVGPYEFYFETEIDAPRVPADSGRSARSRITVSKRLRDESVLISGRLPLEQVEAARDLWRGPVASAVGPAVILRDRPDDVATPFEPGEAFLVESPERSSALSAKDMGIVEDGNDADLGYAEQAEQDEMLAALEASLDVDASEALPGMEAVEDESTFVAAFIDDEATAESADATGGSPMEEPTARDADEIAAPSARRVEDAGMHEEIAMANDRETAGADASSEKPFMQELIHQRAERLASKTDELRRRVAAAQAALDERASKHRARLEEERRRLEQRRADLRRQANALLRASGGRPMSGDESSVDDIVPSKAQIERLLSGEVELTDAMNRRATESRMGQPESTEVDPPLDGLSLEQRVAELISVAKRERQEIEKGESLIESLRFETERRRASLARRREKLQQRDANLRERFSQLEKDRAAIAEERGPLEARLQRLAAEERAVDSRIAESRRLREDLDSEADGLRLEQEKLEKRRRELLNNLETERHRLQARQAELHRKAAELAEAAREKRTRVEMEMSERQSEIQAQEAELRAQRLEIEASTRRELERTANELEQVLQVRLNDIDDELVSRKADLDARVEEVSGSLRPIVRERLLGPTDSIEAPLREIAEQLIAPRRRDDMGVRRGVRRDGPGMSSGTSRLDAKLRMGDGAETAKEEAAVAVGSDDSGNTPEAAKVEGASKA